MDLELISPSCKIVLSSSPIASFWLSFDWTRFSEAIDRYIIKAFRKVYLCDPDPQFYLEVYLGHLYPVSSQNPSNNCFEIVYQGIG